MSRCHLVLMACFATLALAAPAASAAAPAPVVAVVDSGVDMTHAALRDHLWTNPGEIAGNGADDDRNGFVDDVHGADFVTHTGAPLDPRGHGTHIAGIVSRSSKARVMALRVIGRDGIGTDADLAAAIDYAVARGARVLNLSVAYYDPSRRLQIALQRASDAGVLIVAAAGNERENLDARPLYPASYHVATMLVVAATERGKLAAWSARGRTGVDIAAPGRARSTLPGNRYGVLQGTSQATARVSRAAGLLFEAHPALTGAAARAALLRSTDRDATLTKTTASGGALDADRALAVVRLSLG